MKLMKENRQSVTRDPEKAHLFCLPYGARQLQSALCVPNSHNLRPLSIFLLDYVNMLAAKYPFGNLTHDSNHFLVACHDWGQYTLKEHEELITNTVKVICNADASEGILEAGKDISLPETLKIPNGLVEILVEKECLNCQFSLFMPDRSMVGLVPYFSRTGVTKTRT